MVSDKSGYVYRPSFNPQILSNLDGSANTSQFAFIGENKTFYNKKGKVKEQWTTNYSFNDGGSLVRYASYLEDKLVRSWNYFYSDSGEIIRHEKLDGKGRVNELVEQEFSTHGITSYRSYNKKQKEVRRNDYAYNLSGQLKEQRNYKNGKVSSWMIHEYYENGEKQSTTYYNKRGKLKDVWEYSCDPRGVEVKKSDTNTVCVSKESLENGGRMEVWVTTTTKGEKVKRILRYDHNDRIVKIQHFYRGSDQLQSEMAYAYEQDEKVFYEYRSYFSNGQLKYQTTEKMTDDKQSSLDYNAYNKRGKLKYGLKTDYVINDKLVVSKTSYRLNGTKILDSVYTYH